MAKAKNTSVRKTVGVAMLIALVLVLQFLSYSIPSPLPFNLSFVLVPIVIAGVCYDGWAAGIVGFFFGLYVSFCCMFGIDKSGLLVYTASPFWCFVMCIGKGTLCGILSALVYEPFRKKPEKRLLGIILAAIVCPTVNTGTFITCMFLFFRDLLRDWSAGKDLLTYAIVGLAGINYIVELAINLVLCPSVSVPLLRMRNHSMKM